jgi:AraC-like DNA-binding protein
MARIIPLWRSDAVSLHRFDHPAEHEDQPYAERSTAYQASFVEDGRFNLSVGEGRWRVAPGDVMLQHPGMRFSVGFEDESFNDTCLTLIYLGADDDRFVAGERWKRASPVRKATNRLRYLRWGLLRALETRSPMFIEHCAEEVFCEAPKSDPGPLFREHKLAWYAERVHAACERMNRDYAETLTTSDLARSTGMSLFHFARVFAELTGVPPHRYLLNARLKAARRMLLDGRSVTDTCFAAGFGNLSHFSRSYARRFGVSPSRVAA